MAASLRRCASSPSLGIPAYADMRDYVLRLLESEGAMAGRRPPERVLAGGTGGFRLHAGRLASPRPQASAPVLSPHRPEGLRLPHARDQVPRNFKTRLDKLKAVDPAGLLVPEAQDLGGFGHEIDGQLYNVDTLKFYEALIALELGGVLPGLREGQRKVVIEIGAGWGGFARALTAKVPGVTYVIVDLPQVLLFSGTYLSALRPDWKVFKSEAGHTLPPDRYGDYDLVLIPHFVFPQTPLPALDLAVNMVSFQEMTKAQVEGYVERLLFCGLPLSLQPQSSEIGLQPRDRRRARHHGAPFQGPGDSRSRPAPTRSSIRQSWPCQEIRPTATSIGTSWAGERHRHDGRPARRVRRPALQSRDRAAGGAGHPSGPDLSRLCRAARRRRLD